jgi:hypothetical protein
VSVFLVEWLDILSLNFMVLVLSEIWCVCFDFCLAHHFGALAVFVRGGSFVERLCCDSTTKLLNGQ